ncbi:MAG: hypothetical protein MI892_09155, partial [Desulfobacterales bacterium]|nr:hypothetical protein [Desulfobacterales bacterium]
TGILKEKSKNVGSIKGEFGVSSFGSATYNIPIEIPQGINGIQPSISLSYNSSANEGLAGMGWSLNGVSYIAVTSQNLFSDGNIAPVVAVEKEAANKGNRLMLDGQRLIRIGDNNLYLKDGAKFMTQNKNYTSITYHKSGSDNYFVVENANGTKMYYGTSTDSKFKNSNGYVLMWYLKRTEDVHGNYCTYTYKAAGSSKYLLLPDKIEYAANTNAIQSPVYSVKFMYQANSQAEVKYLHGQEVNNKVLIEKIQAYTGDNLLSTYYFEYFKKDRYSYLNTVNRQIGPNKEKIPKTVLSYDKTHKLATVSPWSYKDTLYKRDDVHSANWTSKQFVKRIHQKGVYYVTQDDPYRYLQMATQADIDAAGGSWDFKKAMAKKHGVPRKKPLEHKANNVSLKETVYKNVYKYINRERNYYTADLNNDGINDIFSIYRYPDKLNINGTEEDNNILYYINGKEYKKTVKGFYSGAVL